MRTTTTARRLRATAAAARDALRHADGSVPSAARDELLRSRRSRFPPFVAAVVADARITASYRGERSRFRSRADTAVQVARLALVHDSFLAQMLYRAKASLQARGVPLLPALAHRGAIVAGQVCIGDPVIVHPGVYLPHGQVVVDGITEVHSGTVLFPFTTVGLVAGNFTGATIEEHAKIGTGARVLGPVRIGARAQVGANAVVLADVPAGATAVGAPARVVGAHAGAAATSNDSDRVEPGEPDRSDRSDR